MQVTSVHITPIQTEGSLLAFASVVIDGWLRLTGIALHQRRDATGFRLTYPTKQAGLHDSNLFHPITKEGSELIEVAIFQAYKAVSKRSNARYSSANTRI